MYIENLSNYEYSNFKQNNKMENIRNITEKEGEKLNIDNNYIKFKNVKEYYKKIDSKTFLRFNIDYTIEEFIKERLGKEAYLAYKYHIMEKEDYVKIGTMKPKYLGDRNILEYYINLINGWFFEECMISYFESRNYEIIQTGNDRNYKLVSCSFLKPDYDFKIKNKKTGQIVNVEFIDDFKGETKNWILPLRDGKYERVKNNCDFVIALNHKTQDLYFLNVETMEAYKNNNYNYKNSYTVIIPKDAPVIKL